MHCTIYERTMSLITLRIDVGLGAWYLNNVDLDTTFYSVLHRVCQEHALNSSLLALYSDIELTKRFASIVTVREANLLNGQIVYLRRISNDVSCIKAESKLHRGSKEMY